MTGLDGTLTNSERIALLANYVDGTDISTYAESCIGSCIKTGITLGTGNNMLSPNAFITRGKVAVMVQRLLQKSGLI